MSKKGTREVRFDQLNQLYSMYKAEINDAEATQKNVSFSGYVVYESEIPKFVEKHPDVDAQDFEKFLKDFGAFKKSYKKGEGTGKRTTSLNTAEKMESVGVSKEDVLGAIQRVDKIKVELKWLNEHTPNATWVVSCANRKASKVPA